MNSYLALILLAGAGLYSLFKFGHMNRTWFQLNLALLTAAALVSYFFRTSNYFIIVHVVIGVAVLLPLTCIDVTWPAWSFWRHTHPSKSNEGLLLLMSVGLFLGFSLVLGNILNEAELDEARNFVSQAVPLLDAEKIRSGSYPSRLESLPALGQPPKLLRSHGSYISDGKIFRFTIQSERLVFASDHRDWGWRLDN